jgi:hypothetical protein
MSLVSDDEIQKFLFSHKDKRLPVQMDSVWISLRKHGVLLAWTLLILSGLSSFQFSFLSK